MAEQTSTADDTLIDDLTNTDLWSTWFDQASRWSKVDLITLDTAIELGIILLAASIAWPLSRLLKDRFDRLAGRQARYRVFDRLWRSLAGASFPIVWLALQLVAVIFTSYFDIRDAALTVTTSLLSAWVLVRIATVFVANEFLSQTIAVTAWMVAALNILGWLDKTMELLDGLAISLGEVSVSALTIIQGLIALGFLLWITTIIGQIIEGKLRNSPNLTPSIQVLSTKILRIALGTFAVLAALSIVGVDLTALAVFGGAIGVGLGFGLQKIFANLVSGFILLLDKSIKPGDVIAVPDYYGRVDSLGARYVSVTTRDGIEHLIPNEELITTRVENWSHSQDLLRLRKLIGVHYKSDIHKARELCLEAAAETPRILAEPKPNCLLKDFGESSVDLEMRFWINDPMNGRANVTSDLLWRVWDKFAENGIEIPYPQRDLHLRSSDVSWKSEDV